MQKSFRMAVRWAFNFRSWQPNRDEWTLCNQCIQQEECDRIKQFVFTKDAKASMIGRLLMRKALLDFYNILNTDLVLLRTDKGKPYCNVGNGIKSYSFNVSHQGKYAVLAAQENCILGIDIMQLEQRKDVPEFFHTMRNQFTEKEWGVIKSPAASSDQLEMFFRLWCLKESYVKALGIGIGFEINRLDYGIHTRDLRSCTLVTDTDLKVDGQLVKDWTFEEQTLDDHCIAVAVKVQSPSTGKEFANQTVERELKILDFDCLMEKMEPLRERDYTYWDDFSTKSEDPRQTQRNAKS